MFKHTASAFIRLLRTTFGKHTDGDDDIDDDVVRRFVMQRTKISYPRKQQIYPLGSAYEPGSYVCLSACISLALQGWFLTDFATALAIVGAYLTMVTIGPKIMSGMEPIDSYPVRFVYNVVQVGQPRVEIS